MPRSSVDAHRYPRMAPFHWPHDQHQDTGAWAPPRTVMQTSENAVSVPRCWRHVVADDSVRGFGLTRTIVPLRRARTHSCRGSVRCSDRRHGRASMARPRPHPARDSGRACRARASGASFQQRLNRTMDRKLSNGTVRRRSTVPQPFPALIACPSRRPKCIHRPILDHRHHGWIISTVRLPVPLRSRRQSVACGCRELVTPQGAMHCLGILDKQATRSAIIDGAPAQG
jgi:hypothetical protein